MFQGLSLTKDLICCVVTYVYIHIDICVNICIYMYVYICMYIYIYTYIRPTHNALVHFSLERSVCGLECTQDSVHSKS